jgi:hypothetical protein
MKPEACLIALSMFALLGVACSSTEKSRMANTHRMAYQHSVPTEPGLEAVAEAPHSLTSWGGNLGPY